MSALNANNKQHITKEQEPGNEWKNDNSWLEVVEFLKSLNFGQYIDRFRSEGFDRMDALLDIDMDDLRDMNVKRGHAKMLLTQINIAKASKAIGAKQPKQTQSKYMKSNDNNSRSLNGLVEFHLSVLCIRRANTLSKCTAIIV